MRSSPTSVRSATGSPHRKAPVIAPTRRARRPRGPGERSVLTSTLQWAHTKNNIQVLGTGIEKVKLLPGPGYNFQTSSPGEARGLEPANNEGSREIHISFSSILLCLHSPLISVIHSSTKTTLPVHNGFVENVTLPSCLYLPTKSRVYFMLLGIESCSKPWIFIFR